MDHKASLLLVEIATETAKKLQVLWDEIGTSREEREANSRRTLQEITMHFHQVLKNEQVGFSFFVMVVQSALPYVLQ